MPFLPACLGLLIAATFSLQVIGANVVKIGVSKTLAQVSHDPEHPWDLGEDACYLPIGTQTPRCGRVILTTQEGALLHFSEPQESLTNGAIITVAGNGMIFPSPAIMAAANKERSRAEQVYFSEMITFYQELGLGGVSSAEWSSAF